MMYPDDSNTNDYERLPFDETESDEWEFTDEDFYLDRTNDESDNEPVPSNAGE